MKNILFITYDFPFPTNSGGKNRAYHMLKFSGKHNKYLFSFIREDYKKENSGELEKIGVEIAGVVRRRKTSDIKNSLGLLKGQSIFKTLYYSKDVLEKIVTIVKEKNIDIVHFESYYVAFFISDKLRKMGVKQIFGTENIEYKTYESYSKNAFRFITPLINNQVNRIKKEEQELFKNADMCIAVSEPDAEIVRTFNKCEVIKNGVDIDLLKFIIPSSKKGKKLLFVGNFTYAPNVDAINYFYKNIFINLPDDYRLLIIGKNGNELKISSDKRVEIREFIPNILDAYHEADLMVAPIRLGGGTNFKLLEAFAAGLPVVSLPERLKGLALKDNKNIIIVRDSKEFVEKIVSTLNDLDLRKRISIEARKLVEDEYSWDKIGKKLGNIWEKI